MPLHVSSTCAHHQEVKIALLSLWYHQTETSEWYKITKILMFIGACIILIVEKRETNLKSLALLFPYLLLNMFWMLIHPSSGACDLLDALLHGSYCSGSLCVGVTLWFGWGGVT